MTPSPSTKHQDPGPTDTEFPLTTLSQLQFVDIYLRIDQPQQGRYNPIKKTLHSSGNLPIPASLNDDLEILRQAILKEPNEDSSYTHDNLRLRIAKKELSDKSVWASMRRVDPGLLDVDRLNIKPRLLDQLKQCGKRCGLLLIVGATGNGKTTTASALLNYYMKTFGGVTFTLEDPVEFLFQGPVGDAGYCFQVHVQDDEGWAQGLKTALRWHPNYIYVGEIRTPEAAAQMLRAATSGQFVITTVHGGSIEEGLAGLLQVASSAVGSRANTLLADGLIGVLHQTLTPAGPQIKFLFTEDNNMGDPIRACVRDGELKLLGTNIAQQNVRLFGHS
ncbi:MAG: Tfp pilus assembly pilus retraction ATPase PilT [Burkholderiaceae bacterium]|jgi:Tfp pilus assembly pilus retraction ATPase PilT